MTHLDPHPVVARDSRTTTHRVLAALVGLATLVYAGLAVWLAQSTYEGIRTAAPTDDTSLYGVGYVFAMLSGAAALTCAAVGYVGWRGSRRSPVSGAAVLVCGIVLGLVPITWLVDYAWRG